jgi:GMP synthase-like glutamine amidotransferase
MRLKKSKKILFLDILTDHPQRRRWINKHIFRGNTYSGVTRREFGTPKKRWILADASKTKLPADPTRYAAIVIGGSLKDPAHGADKDLPWMKRVYTFIRRAAKKNVPILGICGGIQFTVKALGGTIVVNPKGREIGNITIALKKTGKHDPLFRGIPNIFTTLALHRCMVKKLQPDWTLLASSKKCSIQAVGIGDYIRLVQFHPEMSKNHVGRIILMRKKRYVEEGYFKSIKEINSYRKSMKDTSRVGKMLLRNFLKYFVDKQRH